MKKRGRARSFTLIELLVAVVILTILASVSVTTYQRYRQEVSMMVDKTNLKILATAVRIHAIDTGTTAGDVSQLRDSDLERAYALVASGKQPYTFLAYLKDWIGVKTAQAETLPPKYYNNDPKVLSCTIDETNPARGNGHSYAIVERFRNRPVSELMNLANQDEDLIFESNDNKTALERRHRIGRRRIAMKVSVGGKPRRDEQEDTSSGNNRGGGGRHGDNDDDDDEGEGGHGQGQGGGSSSGDDR